MVKMLVTEEREHSRREEVANSVSSVAADREQDVEVAPNEVIHGGSHIDRTAGGAQDRSAVLVNIVNEGRREHYSFRATRRIETLVTASKTQDLRHSIGVMEFEKQSADHAVQAWTQAPAGYDTGARPLRVEKQFRSRPGKLKQHIVPCGHGRVASISKGILGLVTDSVSHR